MFKYKIVLKYMKQYIVDYIKDFGNEIRWMNFGVVAGHRISATVEMPWRLEDVASTWAPSGLLAFMSFHYPPLFS